eukprot:TRINITY_DN11443_c0_g1_i1.p1 TRINITY_DN11443_c0_g1~~TRINITY_DN11443_c0_g1_i1.p1  ORF type:complete len:261 (+),score=67.12 TRINITY_DN11443_c0_g1_i1:14-796(+)
MNAYKSSDFTTLSLHDDEDEKYIVNNNDIDNNLRKPLVHRSPPQSSRISVVPDRQPPTARTSAGRKRSRAATVCAWTLFVLACVTIVLVIVAMLESSGFAKAVSVTPESFLFTGFKFHTSTDVDASDISPPEVSVDYSIRIRNDVAFDLAVSPSTLEITYATPSAPSFQSFGTANIPDFKVKSHSESVVSIPIKVDVISTADVLNIQQYLWTRDLTFRVTGEVPVHAKVLLFNVPYLKRFDCSFRVGYHPPHPTDMQCIE